MAATKFTKETYLYWYEMMLLLRRFEEKTGQLYGMQKIRGFCHLYIGQEALAAGCMTATRQEDPFITAYRDHGLALAKGMSANTCMAELFGKATGCSKGKGGSMHFFGVKEYFFGGHGIVGAQIGTGAGLALGMLLPQMMNSSMNKTNSNSIEPMEKIKKLKELLELGAITQAEFDEKKAVLFKEI